MAAICASAYWTGKCENSSAGQPVPASSASNVAASAPMRAKAKRAVKKRLIGFMSTFASICSRSAQNQICGIELALPVQA